MGYDTQFKGELTFTKELTASQIVALKNICGEDCRDHPEWGTGRDLYCIDLELTEDLTGLKWSGSEKTYDLDKLVNVLISQMRARWPEFGLTGSLMAQGEDIEDRWSLTIGEDGLAHKIELKFLGKLIECPHCGEKFEVSGES